MNKFKELLIETGVMQSSHIMLHSSFKNIRKAFPSLSIELLIKTLQEQITPSGSLIMPAFTYCFKKANNNHEIFDRINSPSKVGAVSEVFRNSPGVIRTSSPTHSFSLWGNIKNEIDKTNSPESPLGKGSVVEWLSQKENSFILLLGADFSSLTFCHYLEIITPVPWSNIFPWEYHGITNIGISNFKEQVLQEVPGCAKSFIHFQNYLEKIIMIENKTYFSLNVFFLPISFLLKEGKNYFKNNHDKLLCSKETCPACDERRHKLNL